MHFKGPVTHERQWRSLCSTRMRTQELFEQLAKCPARAKRFESPTGIQHTPNRERPHRLISNRHARSRFRPLTPFFAVVASCLDSLFRFPMVAVNWRGLGVLTHAGYAVLVG
ncbi:hypothetical protein FA15DRAFT_421478 [Coprinopsis marcescibilis]|uniref:Uncharacterized protein n=1 Tax=Coprinopsis marcescibilis TaxID=230819 RepID=A0A5C3KV01_COPMA|nr:hypothetical protein FA15DRAFT_421478 [Coprinopsis marcescibilis]